jgi:hypothetical protein
VPCDCAAEVIAALINGTFAANLTHNAIYMMRPDYSLLRSLRFADANVKESPKSVRPSLSHIHALAAAAHGSHDGQYFWIC